MISGVRVLMYADRRCIYVYFNAHGWGGVVYALMYIHWACVVNIDMYGQVCVLCVNVSDCAHMLEG